MHVCLSTVGAINCGDPRRETGGGGLIPDEGNWLADEFSKNPSHLLGLHSSCNYDFSLIVLLFGFWILY